MADYYVKDGEVVDRDLEKQGEEQKQYPLPPKQESDTESFGDPQ